MAFAMGGGGSGPQSAPQGGFGSGGGGFGRAGTPNPFAQPAKNPFGAATGSAPKQPDTNPFAAKQTAANPFAAKQPAASPTGDGFGAKRPGVFGGVLGGGGGFGGQQRDGGFGQQGGGGFGGQQQGGGFGFGGGGFGQREDRAASQLIAALNATTSELDAEKAAHAATKDQLNVAQAEHVATKNQLSELQNNYAALRRRFEDEVRKLMADIGELAARNEGLEKEVAILSGRCRISDKR